jgi:hypothetical protein
MFEDKNIIIDFVTTETVKGRITNDERRELYMSPNTKSKIPLVLEDEKLYSFNISNEDINAKLTRFYIHIFTDNHNPNYSNNFIDNSDNAKATDNSDNAKITDNFHSSNNDDNAKITDNSNNSYNDDNAKTRTTLTTMTMVTTMTTLQLSTTPTTLIIPITLTMATLTTLTLLKLPTTLTTPTSQKNLKISTTPTTILSLTTLAILELLAKSTIYICNNIQ